MHKYICIHGHFYQPPRENAWLEDVEVQDSAFPFHDWNEKITAECYNPNASSRILDEDGYITDIVNNYTRISYNFGPTLLSWLEKKEPETYQAIIDADKKSRKRFSGHGSALAQTYNHLIMPLANRRDKETQVIWGIRDFQYRFGRDPEGMWLSETAVDLETLEILSEYNIKFTILAPRQAEAIKKLEESDWSDVSQGNIDTGRPYLYKLPNGKKISIFFYNGELSQAIAFNNLLSNGKNFAEKLLSGFSKSKEPQLVHVATDGESYGHHHKHGEMALAFGINYIENNSDASITNYAEFLEKFPPEYEVKIKENSSWSCAHGIERWRSDCGCQTGGDPEYNQKWRRPLRESLNWLRDSLINIYLDETKRLLKDPWKARNDFIEIILHRDDKKVQEFFKKHGLDIDHNGKISKGLRLLEMQRHSLLMFTSCGWFFNDISGIETIQVLQYACRAIQLAGQTGGVEFEIEFIKKLEEAASNIPQEGTGADIYRKYVIPSRLDLMRVGMHYAVSSVFHGNPQSLSIFNYSTESGFFEIKEGGVQRLSLGKTTVKSKTTYSEKTFTYAVLYLGQHNIIGNISIDMDESTFNKMHDKIVRTFNESRIGDVIGIMQSYFGPDKYTIWHLFKDEKRKVLNEIMWKNLAQVENDFMEIYNRDYQFMSALLNDDIPLPNAYKLTLEYVLNTELMKLFEEEMNLNKLNNLVNEFTKWDIKVTDEIALDHNAGVGIYKMIKKLEESDYSDKYLIQLNKVFKLLKDFRVKPNLRSSQNLYFKILQDIKSNHSDLWENTEWNKNFGKLGDFLGVKVQ